MSLETELGAGEAMSQENGYWLCDYDLPSEPAPRRARFYRALNQLIKRVIKESTSVRVISSTQSVFITNHKGLARNLQALAQDFGASSHVYKIGIFQSIEEWLE